MEMSASSPGDIAGTSDDTPAQLEVSTHQMQSKHTTIPGVDANNKLRNQSQLPTNKIDHVAKTSKPKQDLLALATQRNPTGQGIDINKMMSQPSKSRLERPQFSAKFTEVIMPRSDYTPEINVHETFARDPGSSTQGRPDDGQADDGMDSEEEDDDFFAGVVAQTDPFGLHASEAFAEEETQEEAQDDAPLINLDPVPTLDMSALTLKDSSSPENKVPDLLSGNSDDEDDFFKDIRPQEDPFGLLRPVPETMSGQFSQVEKPVPLKDRILPKPDGTGHMIMNFVKETYEAFVAPMESATQGNSSESHNSNTESTQRPVMRQHASPPVEIPELDTMPPLEHVEAEDLPDPDGVVIFNEDQTPSEDMSPTSDQSVHDPDETYHEDSTVPGSQEDSADHTTESNR